MEPLLVAFFTGFLAAIVTGLLVGFVSEWFTERRKAWRAEVRSIARSEAYDETLAYVRLHESLHHKPAPAVKEQ